MGIFYCCSSCHGFESATFTFPHSDCRHLTPTHCGVHQVQRRGCCAVFSGSIIVLGGVLTPVPLQLPGHLSPGSLLPSPLFHLLCPSRPRSHLMCSPQLPLPFQPMLTSSFPEGIHYISESDISETSRITAAYRFPIGAAGPFALHYGPQSGCCSNII